MRMDKMKKKKKKSVNMYILNLLIWENCTYCKYLMNIWRIGEVPDQVDYTKSGKIQYHSSTYKGMYNCLAICDILIVCFTYR